MEELEELGRGLREHVVVTSEGPGRIVGTERGEGSGNRPRLDSEERKRREERRNRRMSSNGHNEERCECELCKGSEDTAKWTMLFGESDEGSGRSEVVQKLS